MATRPPRQTRQAGFRTDNIEPDGYTWPVLDLNEPDLVEYGERAAVAIGILDRCQRNDGCNCGFLTGDVRR